MVGTKEMYDLMDRFEGDCKGSYMPYLPAAPVRVTRSEIGKHRQFYLNGTVNNAFLAYMMGYAFHKSLSHQDSAV